VKDISYILYKAEWVIFLNRKEKEPEASEQLRFTHIFPAFALYRASIVDSRPHLA